MHTFSFAGRVAATARTVEARGFDGLLVADSQNLNADVWVELALAAAATQRIRLGTGVTNPVTRKLAVTASAAATLQAETGGRAVVGLGRGDSAVTQLGGRPVGAAGFELALAALQGYLAGEEVAYDGAPPNRIAWVAGDGFPKVPVVVAATGPHVIAAAARHADAIDFTVGAEPERLRWAVATARDAAAAAGRPAPSLGAYLNVAVHPDRAAARELVRGSTAIFARFATEGAPADGLSTVTRAGIAALAEGYEPARHATAAAPQAVGLSGDFIDRFAVVGTADDVVARLRELEAIGIERVIVVAGSLDADPADVAASNDRFAADVLPRLSGARA
jgi:5,10-methylenetetrahydromethanopterin reductase